MIANDNKRKARVGIVNVDTWMRCYRIRFTFPKGKRHCLYVPGGQNDETWILALRRAQLISTDILAGVFDKSYLRYCPEKIQKLEAPTKLSNLKDFWQNYKKANAKITSVTTQRENWKQADRCLNSLSPKLLEVDQIENFIAELLQSYSVGTLERVLSDIKAACNLAIR